MSEGEWDRGFAGGMYDYPLSLELLHDFMTVWSDIGFIMNKTVIWKVTSSKCT
jgi:hypothetical protein